MKTISKLMAAAVMTAASVSAQAWWGGPNSWNDGFFGDGGFDFHMSASAHGNGWNRYHNGYAPYYGYAPYGATAPALSAEQQKAFAEQQAQAFEQAREAQRQFAEQMAQSRPEIPALARRPEMPGRSMPASYEDREQMREQIQQQMQDRRDQMLNQVEQQRQAAEEQHAAMRQFMEERRLRRDI